MPPEEPPPSSTKAEEPATNKRPRNDDPPLGRTGGIYIPPFKVARMRNNDVEVNSEAYQKQHWEALRKSINGYVNKANINNIPILVQEMFQENLIRGRGLLARAILRAQLASPGFTHVFAGLLAVVNSRLPEVGQLLITRLVLQFRRAYRRNDKIVCLACLKFLAHLVNQKVLSDITALEVCSLLLETPTNDGVDVCCGFVQDCGQALEDMQPKGLNYIFERLRSILNEGDVDTRTQYVIEKAFEARRKKFADFPSVIPELDLIEEEDQQTHTVDLLDEDLKRHELLDIFKPVDPQQFEAEEKKWREISRDILQEDDGNDGDDSSQDSEEEAEMREKELAESGEMKILDYTEQDLINLRKTVYLCIMSSANFEECVHKLLKLNIRDGQEMEVCVMLIDCCAMERTFSRFFALQAERLCLLKEAYVRAFADCFVKQYAQIHRLDTNKLRNIAKFFAYLLATSSLPWSCLSILVLTEEATSAASRIFIKIIFHDLTDEMGLESLQKRLADPPLQPYLEGLFPRKSSPAHLRFSINFFTAIGLGILADGLRASLKQANNDTNP